MRRAIHVSWPLRCLNTPLIDHVTPSRSYVNDDSLFTVRQLHVLRRRAFGKVQRVRRFTLKCYDVDKQSAIPVVKCYFHSVEFFFKIESIVSILRRPSI